MKKRKKDLKQLHEEMCVLCYEFLGFNNPIKATFFPSGPSVKEFLRNMESLLYSEYKNSDISNACEGLFINWLSESAQAVFYCLVELFISNPMDSVSQYCFQTAESRFAFNEGIEELIHDGLVITIPPEDEHALRDANAVLDNILLSPKACGLLFKGRKELIKSSEIASFGNIVPWTDIQEKDLVFSPALSRRLKLITRAIKDELRVMEELKRNGQRGSLTFLFSGPPGTGKTEFVLQLALSQQRTVINIDASKLGSSYMGLAPMKIRKMFLCIKYISAILPTSPILFIDEADGILGKRVEVARSVDRESNTITNIILEELNEYDGILFAATNHPENLDPAMDRRFLIKAFFPSPDASVREKIWMSKIPSLTPRQAEELSQQFPFSGGYFDNVAKIYTISTVVNKRTPTFDEIKEFCIEQLGDKYRTRNKIGF